VCNAWMESLHAVLLRHGMRAVDEGKAAAAARTSPPPWPAQPPAAMASPSSALSTATHALPSCDSSLASSNQHTINFSDPTNFFQLQAKIGEGSYGSVYSGVDLCDGAPVAIKVVRFGGRDNLKLRKEIHILRACQSPYIVGYKGAFQKGSNLWVVMQLCEAGSLSDIMQICQRTFSEAQIACIMRHALLGLDYLHQQRRIQSLHQRWHTHGKQACGTVDHR